MVRVRVRVRMRVRVMSVLAKLQTSPQHSRRRSGTEAMARRQGLAVWRVCRVVRMLAYVAAIPVLLKPGSETSGQSQSQRLRGDWAYLAVIPVLLKPGCSMSTGTPCFLSSWASNTAPMLHAARLMWWP